MEFYIWKLLQDVVVQELSVHTVAMDILHSQVDKVALFLVDHVVVTN